MSESTLDGSWLDCPYCGEAAVSTAELWLGCGTSKVVMCRQCRREVPVSCVPVLVVETSLTRKAVTRCVS